MICPRCNGRKVVIAAHVSYADGSSGYGVTFPCNQCQASGEVPDVMADWIVRGRAMRDRRVNGHPYRNLHQEAQRRGMSVVKLSQMENGIIEPIEESE